VRDGLKAVPYMSCRARSSGRAIR